MDQRRSMCCTMGRIINATTKTNDKRRHHNSRDSTIREVLQPRQKHAGPNTTMVQHPQCTRTIPKCTRPSEAKQAICGPSRLWSWRNGLYLERDARGCGGAGAYKAYCFRACTPPQSHTRLLIRLKNITL